MYEEDREEGEGEDHEEGDAEGDTQQDANDDGTASSLPFFESWALEIWISSVILSGF